MSGLSSTMGGRWWAKVLGLLLVPVLIATGLLAATWKSDTRLSKVQAAIVNLDKAVTINGQTVPMGRQLSAQLISAQEGQNFTWILADASSADAGLTSGRYAAVVTIPENFSAAATSYAGAASAAQQATVEVSTSPVAGIADTAVGQSVAQAAAIALNQTLTETYLDQVYVGFNTTGKQFQTVADAAKKLADGSQALSDGLAQAAPGASTLSEGLYQITANGGLLRTGGSGLASGIDQYASGASQSAAGAAQLASGLAQLSTGSAQLRSGVTQLDAGIVTYRAGLVQYTDGATGILSQLPGEIDLLTGIRQLTDPALAGGDTTAYISSVNGTVGTAIATTSTIQSSAAQATSLLGTLNTRAGTGIDDATAALVCPTSVGVAGSAACIGYAAGVLAARDASKTAVASAITAPNASNNTLSGLLAGITTSATALATNNSKIQTIASTTTPLVVAADKTPTAEILATEKAGATELAPGGAGLVAGLDAMRAGVNESLGGKLSLEYGINAYTAGVDQSAVGAQTLSSGMAQLSGGGPALVSGAQQYVSGVNKVLDGIDQAAPGASQLADGLKKSADGSAQLSDGTKQLADGLATGATQVPSYSTSDRTQLSKVVASPISVSSLEGLVQPGAALAALLMILALWAGAFATYTVLPAVRRRLALSSSATAALVVEALRPGLAIVLVQALLVSAVGQAFVKLPAYRWLELTVLLVLAGVAFVAVNHALSAWAKGAGRVVGVAFAVITLATALTSAVPGWLDAIRPLSPLSPAYDAVRAVVSGGPGVTGGVFALIAWTLLGALFSVAAILRARTVSPAALPALS